MPALEAMFKAIVENMYQNGLRIWNEFYPYEEFPGDMEKGNLYVMTDQDEIVAAFSVLNDVAGQDRFEWKDRGASAVYLGRVGVDTRFLRRGIGVLVLTHALEIAKQRNAKFIRLLVSEDNQTAISLYRKNGFTQASGQHNEFSESLNKTIVELGFEKGV